MNLIFLFLILCNIIYNLTGLYYVLLFLISTINLIVATLNLVVDPDNILTRFNQLISIVSISIIIYLNMYELFIRIFV